MALESRIEKLEEKIEPQITSAKNLMSAAWGAFLERSELPEEQIAELKRKAETVEMPEQMRTWFYFLIGAAA